MQLEKHSQILGNKTSEAYDSSKSELTKVMEEKKCLKISIKNDTAMTSDYIKKMQKNRATSVDKVSKIEKRED